MEKLEIKIQKRNGSLEDFNINKILQVIDEINSSLPQKIFIEETKLDYFKNDVIASVKANLTTDIIDVHVLNDIVWKSLIKSDLFEIAKQYIINANIKDKKEEKKALRDQLKFDNNELYVIKRNGEKEKFNIEKIYDIYDNVAFGIKRDCPITDFVEELRKFIVNNIKTIDIYDILIKSAINNISVKNTKWNLLAGRLQMLKLYKLASINRKVEETDYKIYNPKNFLALIKDYIKQGLYDPILLEKYSEKDLLKAGKTIKSKRDMEYGYSTAYMLSKRYLLNPNKIIKELPQEMYMMVALFLAIPEKDENRLDFAFKIYEATSTQKISLPTPTLLNARTKEHQLSSCFITDVDDSLTDIYHNLTNMAQISKNAGGLGSYWGNVRSKGASIRGVEGVSGGVLPWLKLANDTAIAVNQLGARAGAISVTLDIFHADILDFLDMQTETGDIRRKSFDLFPAVSISDVFMNRMLSNEEFTLFDPHEVKQVTGKSIQDYFGEEHKKFYEECENNPKLKLKQKINAKDLFKKLLKSVVETGMPYIFFRDTVNEVNPNKHVGKIYSSNLCCVTADTRIATEDGLKKIGDLYKEKELVPLKVVTDKRTENLDLKEKGIVIRDSIGIYKTGTLDTFKVKTNAGYKIKATDYHKLYVKRGEDLLKLELKDIKVGDRLLIQSGKGLFGNKGNYSDGFIMGLIAGDGTFANDSIYIDLYNENLSFKSELIEYINNIIPKDGKGGYQNILNNKTIQNTENSEKYRIESVRLARYLNDNYGFNKETKLSVPEAIFEGKEDFVRGYIQGLFATDCSVTKMAGGVQIQISSINKNFLEDLQILLSNFGIYCSIYKSSSKKKSSFTYINKNGEYKEYFAKELYILDINGNNAKIFFEENLLKGFKLEKLKRYILEHGDFNKKNFYATITDIEKAEKEDVFDTTEDVTNSVVFNGIVSGQCEIAQNMKPGKFIEEKRKNNEVVTRYEMGDMVTCNLASINIAKVNNEKDIKENMEIITRLLDNVITLNKFPIEEAKYTAERYRSIGIGYMGLAEYLATNKKTYEDPKAQKEVYELFEKYAYYTYYYSNKLAQERGAYPLFEGSEWSKGIINGKDEKWFEQNSKMAKKWSKLIENMKETGVRFGYHTSPAPNTSTGQLVGTTAGLVPIYKKFFIETNSKGSIVNIAPNLNEDNFWFYKEYVNMKMPPIIDMISGIQEWVDQSISFEWIINPETTSPAELYQNYIHAWKKKIKTVYYVRSMSLNVNKGCESCAG